MPTIRFTDRTIAALKPTVGRQTDYFDRALPGFGVRVNPLGRKTFVLMYRTDARQLRRQSLGTYPLLALADARDKAREELRKATVGRDPAAERQQAKTRTFGSLSALYLEQHAKRKKRSWRDDARMIRRELHDWTELPVGAIRRADVRSLLETVVARGAPVLANRVLALVRKMLNFAVDQEWVDSNVAAKMPRPAPEQSRSRVLTRTELHALWKFLSAPPPSELRPSLQGPWILARAALKLRLTTAQRGNEVLSMRWQDVDGAWWTIPASVAKNKQAHRVYLAALSRAVLNSLKSSSDREYVFAGIRGTRQRRGTLSGLEIEDVRPHDFRRTAASMMTAAGVPRLTVGKVLNHVETGVTAVYDRHSYDAEKQSALALWDSLLAEAVLSPKRTVGVTRLAGKREVHQER